MNIDYNLSFLYFFEIIRNPKRGEEKNFGSFLIRCLINNYTIYNNDDDDEVEISFYYVMLKNWREKRNSYTFG